MFDDTSSVLMSGGTKGLWELRINSEGLAGFAQGPGDTLGEGGTPPRSGSFLFLFLACCHLDDVLSQPFVGPRPAG